MLARFFVAILFPVYLLGLSSGAFADPLDPMADSAAVTAVQNQEYSINLDAATIQKGFTVSAFESDLKLSLVPGILSSSTRVSIVKLAEDLPWPWKVDRISLVYQFEFLNKAAYDNHKPFYIQFAYERADDYHKQVFFYDKTVSAWRPLPTRDFPQEKFVRSLIHLPYARIAVFSHPEVLTVGRASWYAHKTGNYAASPDFPAGSRLRVTNRDNGKFVDVTVNDYGPDRKLHPDRAVDLEKSAFTRLAPLSEGMLDVTVEPFVIAPKNGLVLGVSDKQGISVRPETSVKSALVQEEGGEVYYGKNSAAILPLASLTKLVAAKVFMETGPDLKKTVAYSLQDERYNFEHAKEWEVAKLKLSDGETLTIKDLFYTSLVGSTNNTVESLVRVSGLERGAFIARMNELAREWGATGTSFIEPTGLAPANVSSVRDYVIITTEALKDPEVAKASSLSEYSFTTISAQKPHRIKNTNSILRANKYQLTGSKTGYLDEAGYCLMVRVKGEGGKTVIVVTFGAPDRETSFRETEELLRFGLKKIKN